MRHPRRASRLPRCDRCGAVLVESLEYADWCRRCGTEPVVMRSPGPDDVRVLEPDAGVHEPAVTHHGSVRIYPVAPK
jgi:hypothetical protein